jgi:hypothetical protein
MGVSTDAILVYGVCIGDEYGEVDFPEDPEDEDSGGSYPSESLEAELASEGLELVRHCHGDSPMWILAVKGTQVRAHRGYPVALPAWTKAGSTLDETIRRVAAKNDWSYQKPTTTGPAWILCSYWG